MQELQDGQKSVVLGQAEKSENSAVTKPKSMDNVSPVKKIISLSLKYVVNKDVKIIKKLFRLLRIICAEFHLPKSFNNFILA